MKNLPSILVVIAAVSLVVGIMSRMLIKPLMFGLEANAFLRFTDSCLLFAIALILVKQK